MTKQTQTEALNAMRIHLVTLIHGLCSQIENTLYALRSDDAAVKQARGAIAYALKESAQYNYNGPLRPDPCPNIKGYVSGGGLDHVMEKARAWGAVPDGWKLVRRETLMSWKDEVNTIATLSNKSERYNDAIELKQAIADVLNAAPPAPAAEKRVPLTDEEILAIATKAVADGELHWLGFKEDANGEFRVPSLYPSHFALIRLIERAHGIAPDDAKENSNG